MVEKEVFFARGRNDFFFLSIYDQKGLSSTESENVEYVTHPPFYKSIFSQKINNSGILSIVLKIYVILRVSLFVLIDDKNAVWEFKLNFDGKFGVHTTF